MRKRKFPLHGRGGRKTHALPDVFGLKIRILSENILLR